MTFDREPDEFAPARQRTDDEQAALTAEDHRRRILDRLRGRTDPETAARGAAIAAHFAEDQP